jgi:hypothetical protein
LKKKLNVFGREKAWVTINILEGSKERLQQEQVHKGEQQSL